jgi:pimeloyl-ACP methyl ester carboxylesterase
MAVYGRFSAGRSIIQSVFDMRAGLGTLANQTHIDLTRVGVEGTSWGGFEALYVAAYPPAGVTPRVGVAIAPVTDFQALNTQATVTTPTATSGTQQTGYATFYDKYLRRIHIWTDTNGYGLFQASTVIPRVTQSFLIMQDDWDTMIPSQITKNAMAYAAAHRRRREQKMAKLLITQGGPSHGVLGLIEISDKIARLSEAGYAFETKRRKLEHQFEVTNSELHNGGGFLLCAKDSIGN